MKDGRFMTHYLEDDLFNSIVEKENAELSFVWQIIISDDTLCPVLRRDKVDVYYRGFSAFSMTKEAITRG